MRTTIYRGLLAAFAAAWLVLGVPPDRGGAGEPDLASMPMVLLMVGDQGCIWCARWDAEVREGYLKSREHRFAPLVRRRKGHADLERIGGLVYTPTFVVLRRGEEVGRIVGYPGADFFWAELDVILRRAGFDPSRRDT